MLEEILDFERNSAAKFFVGQFIGERTRAVEDLNRLWLESGQRGDLVRKAVGTLWGEQHPMELRAGPKKIESSW